MATIQPNRRGRQQVLQSKESRELVRETAEKLATAMRAEGIMVDGIPGVIALPVEVDVYETDRARASVTIKHPSGLAVAAKHGLHFRAAASLGLEIVRQGKR